MAVKRSPFLVLMARPEVTKTGKRYYKIQLKYPKSAGGSVVNAKLWEEAIVILEGKNVPLPTSGQYWSEGMYEDDEFDGQPQLNIRSYKVADPVTPDLKEQYRDPAIIDVDATLRYLFFWNYWEEPYKLFFDSLWAELNDTQLLEKLKEVPAGSANHHSRRAGLLQHVTEMEYLARLICRVKESDNPAKYEVLGPPTFEKLGVDFQLLRASIILHDMGKIHDYNIDTLQWDADNESKALAHSQWGAIAVERNWPKHPDWQQKKLFLQHCVLAHHGKSIAAVPPLLPEASLLHQIDAMSAYLEVHRTARATKLEGKPVGYNSMLGDTPIIP